MPESPCPLPTQGSREEERELSSEEEVVASDDLQRGPWRRTCSMRRMHSLAAGYGGDLLK